MLIPMDASQFYTSPVGIFSAVLSVIPLIFMSKAGTSFRFRRIQFPTRWVIGLACAGLSLALFVYYTLTHGFEADSQNVFGLVALIALALYLGLPVIHSKSGFHPAEARTTLPNWLSSRIPEVLSDLQDHLQSIGLKIEDASKWGYDLAARGMIKGTVAPDIRIPYMIFIKIEQGTAGLDVSARADNMDIVISDSGESKNCESLLQATMLRFEQPPYAESQAK